MKHDILDQIKQVTLLVSHIYESKVYSRNIKHTPGQITTVDGSKYQVIRVRTPSACLKHMVAICLQIGHHKLYVPVYQGDISPVDDYVYIAVCRVEGKQVSSYIATEFVRLESDKFKKLKNG